LASSPLPRCGPGVNAGIDAEPPARCRGFCNGCQASAAVDQFRASRLVPSQPGLNPRWCGLICPRTCTHIHCSDTTGASCSAKSHVLLYREISIGDGCGRLHSLYQDKTAKVPADGFEPHQADVHYVLTQTSMSKFDNPQTTSV